MSDRLRFPWMEHFDDPTDPLPAGQQRPTDPAEAAALDRLSPTERKRRERLAQPIGSDIVRAALRRMDAQEAKERRDNPF